MNRSLVVLALFLAAIGARADTIFTGTNEPGQSALYSFSLGAGATNLSLSVSHTGAAFSHLRLRKGAAPTDSDFDFIAHLDGADNRINLQPPELSATNYFLTVQTPSNSVTHEFIVTLATNVSTMRSETNPVIKPLASVITGTLAPDGWQYFQVEILTNISGWRLVLNAGGGGDPDIFVHRGVLPNESSAIKSSRDRATDTITFTDAEAQPGTYFVGIHLPATAGGNATYTLAMQLGYLTELAWDDGSAHAGTQVFTNQSATGGDYYFKITTQNPSVAVWRTALNVTSGEANLYMSYNSLPASNNFQFNSARVGSDGFVLDASQFSAAQDWFILVTATPGAQWNLVTGDAYVQDLGTVANDGSSGSGSVPIGAEGMRVFKTTMPVDLLAWRLWLNGANNSIFVKTTRAPHPVHAGTSYDLAQSGQMLVAPTYLAGGDLYFVGVTGAPGETISLDSRLHSFTPLDFNSTTNFSVSGFGYVTLRVQVPVEQIAWEIKASAVSGDPNVAVRRNLVPNEFNNDAFSEVNAPTADSVTLVPPNLTDGTFYITIYGSAPYSVSLRNGNPVITDINYVDSRVNDDPSRVGWRYYRVANIAQQLGTLGWDLILSNQPPGTEIAIRRNAVPGRWNSRTGGPYVSSVGQVDDSGLGFLQRPGHQADIWYVGIYHPTQALGSFRVTSGELIPVPLSFNSGTFTVSNVPAGKWQFFRIDVPANAFGWDVRLTNVTSGQPNLMVRRDRLPNVLGSSPWWFPDGFTNWPSGFQWGPYEDWTTYPIASDGLADEHARILACGMGNPLEPGTYYVGVNNYPWAGEMNYSVSGRGIGTGFSMPVQDLAFNGGAATNDLPPREAAYYRVSVPGNAASWQVKLTANVGESMLVVRKGALPNVHAAPSYSAVSFSGAKRIEKVGHDHYALMPEPGTNVLDAGEYYLAVVGEGMNPGSAPGGRAIGTNHSTFTLRSLGPVTSTNFGVLGATDFVQAVTQENGELRLYQVTVPSGAAAIEARLEDRAGNPLLAGVIGGAPPRVHEVYGDNFFDYYGNDGGQESGRKQAADIITIPNPPAGLVTFAVRANANDNGTNASYTLRIRSHVPENVAFDGGTISITDQVPNAWRFFRLEVPTNALGWEVRLTNVIDGTPKLVLCRDRLPVTLDMSGGPAFPDWYWGPLTATNWPAGYQFASGVDWTGWERSADDTDERNRIIALGMGHPLQPGVYYAGVLNTAESNANYSIASRGIGDGMALPVIGLPFTAGAITNTLAPREAAYYRVTVPTNVPGWKVKLTAETGDVLLLAGRAVPGITVDYARVIYPPDGYWGAGRRMRKPGNEHFVLLPDDGTNQLAAGSYYLVVAGEGENPGNNRIGTGVSTYVLESAGVISVEDLGTVTSTEIIVSETIESGEFKPYRFTVPPDSASIEIRLEEFGGLPVMLVRPGEQIPNRFLNYYGDYDYSQGILDEYGVDGGQATQRIGGTSVITLSTPAPGIYALVVKAALRRYLFFPPQYDDAVYTLHLRALGATPLEFDGGAQTVSAQGAGTWNYFRVDVPTNALGWDVRLTDVTAGHPRLVVRRDLTPETLTSTGGNEGWPNPGISPWYYGPFPATNWPSGFQIAAGPDWTDRQLSSDGSDDENQRIIAMGMGNPLEPGTYLAGVFAETARGAATYTLRSRGIGAGMSIPIVDVNYSGGTITNSGLVAREAAYYRVAILSNTPSWRVNLVPTDGEALMSVQQSSLPSTSTGYGRAAFAPYYYFTGGREMQKDGNEHFVLLPDEGQDFIPAGDYFIAVVSEGVNPEGGRIGEGSSSYELRTGGPMPVENLGTITTVGVARTNLIEGGEFRAFQFTLPDGASNVEVSLTDRSGYPALTMHHSSRVPNRAFQDYYTMIDPYGADGGDQQNRFETDGFLTIPNPLPGLYTLGVKARQYFANFPDAGFTLRVREIAMVDLNFSAEFNTNGMTNVVTGVLADNQRAFYRVFVPATDAGAPVVGWRLDIDEFQGRADVRARRDALPIDGNPGTTSFVPDQSVMVPPLLTPGTWYVEVRASGSTEFTLTSSALRMERAWTMPMNGATNPPPGIVAPEFGDSGTETNGAPLPGDRGTDLEQGKWHFYLVQVPTNNPAVLRVQLEAISGVPNLFVRTGAPPTLVHLPLYDAAFAATGTEYANLVPPGGVFWQELTAGPWYLAVYAGGNANVRYRIRVSTGAPLIQDLALDGGAFANQIIAAKDWRYYRVQIPSNAPVNWNVTFSQQVGDVLMYVRDSVPPGNGVPTGYYEPVDWSNDNKNHGPYPNGLDNPGTHTFNLPPVRPGATYYLGFRAQNDATFSVSSSISGGVASFPLIGFDGGSVSNVLAPNSALTYRINVPADAARWIHSAVHSDQVVLFLEQGTIPRAEFAYYPPQHWRSYGPNSAFDYWLLYPNNWPWLPNHFYFLTVTNQSAAPEPFSFAMNGRDLLADDDGDGLPDAWEIQYFGGLAYDGNGDQDHDGLSNRREYERGTNPNDRNSPGFFASILLLEGGATELSFSGETSRTYRVEASTNLQNWVPLTNAIPPGVPWLIRDLQASNHFQRFYRAIRMP